MDLYRAFDCIPHDLFVAKLHAYGLSLDAKYEKKKTASENK